MVIVTRIRAGSLYKALVRIIKSTRFSGRRLTALMYSTVKELNKILTAYN